MSRRTFNSVHRLAWTHWLLLSRLFIQSLLIMNALRVQITINSTLYVPGTLRIQMPSVKPIGLIVREIRVPHTDIQAVARCSGKSNIWMEYILQRCMTKENCINIHKVHVNAHVAWFPPTSNSLCVSAGTSEDESRTFSDFKATKSSSIIQHWSTVRRAVNYA